MISSLSVSPIRWRITILVVLSLAAVWLVSRDLSRVVSAQGSPGAFRNFEGPQIHPLALTPDGTRLLAVNTPNATLSIFQLVSGSPVLTAEIPVGLEPVSVAARTNREAWVVNWLSDSVSVVDLSTGNVTRTIDVGDEPTDVLFAGLSNEKAFVCVSGGGTQSVSLSSITGASGAVKVFPDASNPSQGSAQTIQISGKQPRALARSDDGSRVFVSVFESGNQTAIVSQSAVTPNGGMPPPNPAMNPSLPAAPNTGLIVKWNGSNWVDELNRSWNSVIPYTLADIDLVVIDASGAPPLTVSSQVRGLSTHLGNMAFDPVSQRLLVANLDDINQVRFEPNVRGRFQATRVSVLNAPAGTTPTLASVSDLNSHVDLNNAAGTDAERALSLAMPPAIKRAADSTRSVAA